MTKHGLYSRKTHEEEAAGETVVFIKSRRRTERRSGVLNLEDTNSAGKLRREPDLVSTSTAWSGHFEH